MLYICIAIPRTSRKYRASSVSFCPDLPKNRPGEGATTCRIIFSKCFVVFSKCRIVFRKSFVVSRKQPADSFRRLKTLKLRPLPLPLSAPPNPLSPASSLLAPRQYPPPPFSTLLPPRFFPPPACSHPSPSQTLSLFAPPNPPPARFRAQKYRLICHKKGDGFAAKGLHAISQGSRWTCPEAGKTDSRFRQNNLYIF